MNIEKAPVAEVKETREPEEVDPLFQYRVTAVKALLKAPELAPLVVAEADKLVHSALDLVKVGGMYVNFQQALEGLLRVVYVSQAHHAMSKEGGNVEQIFQRLYGKGSPSGKQRAKDADANRRTRRKMEKQSRRRNRA